MIFRKIAKLLNCYIAGNKENNLTIQQYNNYNPQKGFTLIELMVALSITAVLGTLGIAGFVSYNQNQVLQASTSEVVTMLNLAKSRAQSQIKPSVCIGDLSGYKVAISFPGTYALYVRCSISSDKKIAEQDKQLPAKLSFSSGSDLFIFFPVHTGGAQVSGADDQFVISSSDGKTKTIKINSLGGVSTE